MNEYIGAFADRLSDRIGRPVALVQVDAAALMPDEPCVVVGRPGPSNTSQARRSSEDELVETLRALGNDPAAWGSTPPSADGVTYPIAVIGRQFGSNAAPVAPEGFRV